MVYAASLAQHLLALLLEEDLLDVGQDTAAGNGHTAEQLVQFLVVTDGQLRGKGR